MTPLMNRTGKATALAAAAIFFLAALAPPAAAAGPDGPTFAGPLRVSNVHPLFIAAGAPELLTAEPVSAASATLSYGSTFLVKNSPAWGFAVDLETALLELRASRAFGAAEVYADVPFISHNGGFLDGLLDRFHSATGTGDYGRSERPHNEFLYDVARNGNTVIDGRGGEAAIGDVTAGLKLTLMEGDPWVSVNGYVELPTGDADRGYGTGGVDWGLGVLVNKAVGERVMIYINGGYVLAGDLEAVRTAPLDDYLYGGAGVEWAWRRDLSLHAQVLAQGSPFETTGVDEVDDLSMVLTFGGRYRFGESTLEFSFSEDPTVAGAPDFMVTTGLSRRF